MSYVITFNNRAQAVAATLEAAKAEALRQGSRYAPAGREYEWTEQYDGTFRLQGRDPGRKRYSWTLYGVTEVPDVD